MDIAPTIEDKVHGVCWRADEQRTSGKAGE